MNITTKNMMAVLTKLLGVDGIDCLKLLGYGDYVGKGYPLEIIIHQSEQLRVSVGWRNLTTLLAFTIAAYPACCGIRMFHSFRVMESEKAGLNQDFMDALMNAFMQDLKDSAAYKDWMGSSGRLEVIMVEYRLNDERLATTELEPVENPKIQYKTLWNYFHKHAKLVRTRLQHNSNTGNILHNMEVIFEV